MQNLGILDFGILISGILDFGISNSGILNFGIPTFGFWFFYLLILEFNIWNFVFGLFCYCILFAICDLSVLRFFSFAISQFWDLSVLRFVSFAICQFCDLSVLQFVSFAICQFCDLSVLKFVSFAICQFCKLLFCSLFYILYLFLSISYFTWWGAIIRRASINIFLGSC